MLGSLQIPLSGLNASKQSVENVMNDISNENTPGYKRRIVELSELEHVKNNDIGRGVSIDGIRRVTNRYLNHTLVQANGKSGYLDERSDIMANVENTFKETESSGLTKDLNDFFQSLEDVRAAPANEIYKTDLKNRSNDIIHDLKNLYGGTETKQKQMEGKVEDNVEAINGILNSISDINKQLESRTKGGTDLLDRRDLLEAKLSKFVGIVVHKTPPYSLDIEGTPAIVYGRNVHPLRIVQLKQAQSYKYSNGSGLNNLTTTGTGGFGTGDEISIMVNNNDKTKITINFGEKFTKADKIDVDGDGVYDSGTVDAKNYIRVLAAKVNNSGAGIYATNGAFNKAHDGSRYIDHTVDHFLVLRSTKGGEANRFKVSVIVKDATAGTKTLVNRNLKTSKEAEDISQLAIANDIVNPIKGSLRADLEVSNTSAPNNLLSGYRAKLDDLADALSDITSTYIKNPDGSYISGQKATDLDTSGGVIHKLKFFSGSTVDSLKFNNNSVNGLTQDDVDYLSSIQFKENVQFDGSPQDNTSKGTTFTVFYRNLLVKVSADKESNDSQKTTQDEVTHAIQLAFNKLTKVDKDEEMVNLIKFQSAYTASAKTITTMDQMIKTLLNMT